MFFSTFFFSLFSFGSPLLGLDVTQFVSVQQFQCLKENDFQFLIVRIYRSNGVVDWKSAQTIRNGRAAGFRPVYAYFLPCLSCEQFDAQITETIEFLKDESINIDRIWLNVEGQWNNDINFNIRIIDEFIQNLQNSSMKFGIFTNPKDWMKITNGTEKFSLTAPLWYSNMDDRMTFDDFQSFAGWNQAAIKQFRLNTRDCGVIFDKNYM